MNHNFHRRNILKSKILQSINPATLDVVGEVEATPPKKVESIVEQARQAFPAWRDLGLEARTRILKRAQQCLLDECGPGCNLGVGLFHHWAESLYFGTAAHFVDRYRRRGLVILCAA